MRKLLILTVLLLILVGCKGKDDDKESASGPTPTPVVLPSDTPLPSTWTATPPGFVASITPSPMATETQASANGTPLPGGPTLPPTWTPSPPGFVPSLTPTEETAAQTQGQGGDGSQGGTTGQGGDGSQPGGQSLPPTWTPYVRPSVTPRPTLPPSSGGGGLTLPTAPPGPAATWTPLPQFCYQLEALVGDFRINLGEPVSVSWSPVEGMSNYMVEVRHPGGGLVFQQFANGTSLEIPGETFTVSGVYGWQVMPYDQNGQPACFPVSGEIMVAFGPEE